MVCDERKMFSEKVGIEFLYTLVLDAYAIGRSLPLGNVRDNTHGDESHASFNGKCWL